MNNEGLKMLTVAACAAVAATALVTQNVSATNSAAAALPVATTTQWSLDAVPGWGRSADAQMRDDSIAYWEAWKRDVSVADCMKQAGFDWRPEAQYPEFAIKSIAEYLKIQAAPSGEKEKPSSVNRRTSSSLAGAERDRYFQTLMGQPADVVDFIENSGGAFPPGVSVADLGTEGCQGRASDAVGSIWATPRSQEDELSELRLAALDDATLKPKRAEYTACAAKNGLADVKTPADVTRARGRGGLPAKAADKVSNDCTSSWNQVSKAAFDKAGDAIKARHGNSLAAQSSKYHNTLDVIRNDAGFAQYVAARIGQFEA